ncbi:MAG: DCC1-like thiol-disulfide oxidoreductase family protein [Alphaproteobacteria bacterium]
MDKSGIYFVYDGDCSLCSSVAQALSIQRAFGTLHLINARQDKHHPIMEAIIQRNLNLDEGMVIYENSRFHHGKDALKFMAKYGQASNALMFLCKSFFWSDKVSSLTYPWMRAVRNSVLRRRNIAQLDNLSINGIDNNKES